MENLRGKLSSQGLISLLLPKNYLFHVHECFTCIVCAVCVCLVSVMVGRRCCIPWNWRYGWLWAATYVGAENWNWVLCNKCSELLSSCLGPIGFDFYILLFFLIRLVLNSQTFACLCLLSDVIKGVFHQTQFLLFCFIMGFARHPGLASNLFGLLLQSFKCWDYQYVVPN